MKKSFIVGWVLLFGFLGAEEVPLERSIVPREEGATWTFGSRRYEKGRETVVGTATQEVVRTLSVEGQRCFRIKQTYDYRSLWERMLGTKPDENPFYFWEYVDENGSHNFAEEGGGKHTPKFLSEFELTLPYPVKKGHSYKAEGCHWTVLNVEKTVKVPAGTYQCVVYQAVYKGGHEEMWSRNRFFLAPGVGLVCLEIDFRKDGKWVLDTRDELMRYRLPSVRSGKE